MERSAVESFLDDVLAGVAGVTEVTGFVRELQTEELLVLLDSIRDRFTVSDHPDLRRMWAGVTAVILLDWASSTDFVTAGDERATVATHAAAAASAIFGSVLGDDESAGTAALAAGMLRLEPGALSDALERFGEAMDVDTRIRLLRLITGSGDSEYNRRYGPILAETVASAKAAGGRVEVLAAARGFLDGDRSGVDPAITAEGLEKILLKAPRDDEFRHAYIDLVGVAGLAERGQAFLMKLSVGFHDDFRTTLLVEAAALQKTADGHGERVLDTLEAAVTAAPADPVALNSYMKTAIEAGETARAAKFVESVRAAVAGTPAEVGALKWQGRLLSADGRDDDAERVWRRIRAIDPRCVDALDFYVSYYAARSDWQKQFSTLQFELSVLDNDEDRIRVNRDMAEVAAKRLNKLDKAAEAYKRILAINPGDDASFDALVDILEKSAKWNALVELFNDRIRRLPAQDVELKVALLFRIVDIYQDPDKQPSQESMLAAYSRISDISPRNELALQTLEAGYESSERWPDLLKVLQRKVEITQDPAELLDLFHRISEIAITRMSNETQAIPFLEKILELDPQNLDVVKRLKTIYGHKHNQGRHYAMLRRELEMVGDGPEREPILLAAAEMARDRLLRPSEALELYEEAYRLNGRLREARENLHLLYNRLELWKEYAVFLASEIECQMPTVRRVELLHKLGEIRMDHLGDIDGAADVYARVLEIDPADEVSASRLERIYIERGDFERIYEVYRGRGEIRRFVAQMSQYELSDARLARDLSLVMSRVCRDDLNDPGRALDHLEDAFIADPSAQEIGRRIVTEASARGDTARVERTLKVLAANGTDPAARQADFMALHALYEAAGRHADAFDAAVAGITANMTSEGLPDLVATASATAAAGELWQPLAALLENVADFTADNAWKRALLVELGGIYLDRLAFHQDARRAWERVLEIAPDDKDALDVLEKIVIQQEDWEGLEGVLLRRLSLSSEPAERQEMHMRLARLYEDLLGDDTRASEAWAGALEDMPEPDRVALAGLHRTLEHLEMWERLAETIDVERGLAAPGWDRSRLDCEYAAVLADGLGRIEEALGVLDGVLAAGPGETALAQVADIFRSARDTALAGSILQAHFQRTGDTDSLLDVLRTRLDRTTAVEARAALLVQIATIRFAEKNDADGAFNDLVASVSTFPTDENVRAMVEMAANVNGWATAADTLETIRNAAADMDPTFDAWISRTLGELYGRRLGNPELAVTAMERAMPFEGEDPAFLSELLSLYRAVGNIDSAMVVFSKLAAVQKQPDRRQTLLERAIFASGNRLVDEAVQTLRGLASEGHDPEADAMLEDLLEEHGRFADLISQLVKKSAAPEYADQSSSINFRIASIYLDQMKLPADAARYVELSIQASPGVEEYVLFAEAMISDRSLRNRTEWVPGLVRVVSDALRGRDGVDDRILSVLRAQVDISDSPADSARLLRAVADVECGRGNHRACYEATAAALNMLPEDPETLAAFIDSARRSGAFAEAVDLMLTLCEGLDGDAGVAMGTAAGRMAFDDMNDADAATRIFKGLADRFPSSIPILRELDAVHAARDAQADRVGVLVRIAGLTEENDARMEITLEAARIALSLGDNIAASRLLKVIVDGRADDFELAGTARTAAILLVDSAMASGDFETAADMHILIGSTSTDPAETRDRYLAAAAVLTEHVNDLPRALSVLQDVMKESEDCRPARDAARELARRMDDLGALLAILADDARLARDDQERIAALLEIAAVQVRPDVGNQEQALEAISDILAAQPSEERAISVLRQMFRDPEWDVRAADVAMKAAQASGDRGLMMDVLRVRIRRASDTAVRSALLRQLGVECVSASLDVEAADAFADAFAEDPLDTESFDALFTELSRQGRAAEFVGHIRRAAGSIDETARRDELRNRAAGLLAGAENGQAALELLQDVLTDSPADRNAVDATIKLSRAAGDWERYASIIRHSIEHIPAEPDAVADAWLECAEVCMERLGDREGAMTCWRNALKIRPLEHRAIDALSRILAESGDEDGLRELWNAELAAMTALPADGRDAARMSWLLIHVAESSLAAGLDDEAIRAAIVLVVDPAVQPASMDAALRIYRKIPDGRLFDSLSSVLQERGENRRLLDLYRFGAARKDIVPGPETCLRRAIEIEEKLRLHDFRFEDLGRLVETCPDDPEALRLFLDTGRKLGRVQKVATLLERTFAANQDADCAFDIAIVLADILEHDLNRAEDASTYLRLAFLRRPEAGDVVERLAAIYTGLGRFGELALLYENLAELTLDPAERIGHYFDAFDVLRRKVESPEGAAEVMKKVLDLDPVNLIAVENLESIARETGNIPELAVWIGHRAELATAAGERRRLRVELAGILDSELGRRDDAIAVLDQLVDEFPDDEAIWAQYEKILISASSFEALADVYMRRARAAQDPAVKLATLKKAASVFEARLDDRFAAVTALEAILEIDPADNFAFERMSVLLEQGSDFDNLVKLFGARAAATDDGAEKVRLNLQVAEILREKLGRPGEALKYYRDAVEVDPTARQARNGLLALVADGEFAVDAALALERVFVATGEHEPLIDILRRQVDLTGDPVQKADLLIRVAAIQHERLGRPGDSIASLGRAMTEMPGSSAAADLLLKVAADGGLWRPAYDIVSAAADAAVEEDDVKRLRRNAGDIASEHLDDMEAAAAHYAAYLLSEPDDLDVMARIDLIYGALGRRDDQVRVIRQRIATVGDRADTGLKMRLAEMLVEDSRDLDGAFEIVRAVLAVEPSNQHAVGLMTILASEPILARRATDVLRRAFLESGDNEGVLKAVEAQIQTAREVSDLIEMHQQAAVAAARLDLTGRELEHLGAALALDPADDALLETTMDCAARLGDGQSAWDVLLKAAKAASWPDLEKKLLLLAVDTATGLGMGDFATVEGALRRVLEIDPTNRPALDLLDAAFSRDGRADELVAVLRHRLRLDLPAAERIGVLVRIGSIYEGRREFKAAAEVFEEAVALGAVDADLLGRLRGCYRELGNVRAEIETVERMASSARDDGARFAFLLEIAALQETELRDVRAARATLERIIAVDENHAGARSALERIYELLEDWESLTRLLNYTVESDLHPDIRLAAALKAASIADNEAENTTLAISFARKATQIDPGSREANDELLRMYFKTQDWTSLVAVMRRKAEFETDPREKVMQLSQAAIIARDSVHDNGLAAMIAGEILAINPDQPEALATMARVRELEGSLDEAMKMYRRLSEMKAAGDVTVEGFLGLSRVLTALKAPDDEISAALKSAAAIAPDHPSVKGFLKQVLKDNREYDKLVALLERGLDEADNDGEKSALAMEIARVCRNDLGDDARFVEWAEKAWALSKDDPQVVVEIVDHHLAAGMDGQAVPYLEWLVNYLEAKRRLKELPGYANQLGRILESSGDTRRAAEYYRICHEHDATNIGNSLSLARLHMRHNELEKATRVLQSLLLRIDGLDAPQKREVLISLARINEARNDRKKARQFVTRLLSEQPDCAEAREMLSRL